jgi:hypothetical protein
VTCYRFPVCDLSQTSVNNPNFKGDGDLRIGKEAGDKLAHSKLPVCDLLTVTNFQRRHRERAKEAGDRSPAIKAVTSHRTPN